MGQDCSTAQAECQLGPGETDTYECWIRALSEHNVQYLVLNPHSKRDIVQLFRSHAGWKVDFEDEDMIMFVRDDSLKGQQTYGRSRP